MTATVDWGWVCSQWSRRVVAAKSNDFARGKVDLGDPNISARGEVVDVLDARL